MNSWSNRFVSAALLALLAGCGGHPKRTQPPVAATVPASSSAATGATGATGGQTGNAAGGTAAAPAAPIPERAAAQYATALQLMKSGKVGDAELEFKQLALAYPDYAGPQLNLGLLYLRDSRLAQAEAAFKGALAISPGSAIAGDELGIALREEGKFHDAEAAYVHAIEMDPNYADAHLNLGILYDLYLAEPQKALDEYERYIAIAGENKKVAGWVAELHKRVGTPGAAKKDPS